MQRYQLRWKNFRGFADTGWIELRPLTIIIGANNSGKTSLLAPLLLLKQSHSGSEPDLALQTKGELINAGAFEDIVFGHEKRKQIQFAIRFHHHDIDDEDTVVQPLGEAPPGELELTFAEYAAFDEPVLKRYTVYDALGRLLLTRSRTASGTYSLEGLKHVSRKRIKNAAFDNALRRNIRQGQPWNFIFSDVPFTTTLRQQALKQQRIHLSEFAKEYLRIVEAVSEQMFKVFFDIVYVGPLRERPKRLYELSGAMPDNVGTRGEFAPEILFRLRETDFIEVVEQWLRRFDFSGHIGSKATSEGGFSLYVGKSKGDVAVNFADTGFGLSQVLPLIIQGFFSNDDLVIAEQPEIHLNPRLQAILGDLFCAIANNGTSMLVETHSEHLILRLRRLVAEGIFRADDIALYFVERQKGKSFIREVPLQKNGHVLGKDWPSGFFGESLRDALALSTAQSRGKKR